MKRTLFILLIGVYLFWGCSKDDSPKEEKQETSKTGKFIDSAVAGVRYETETHSGYTDENGNYDYEEGEIVTFYVGDIMLGSALATGELSPIDIASTPDATIYTPEVQNIAAFLQTLDSDGDPSNGILIEQEILNAISLTSINFTQPILQLLGETVLEIFQKTGKDLDVVFPDDAAAHLAETLGAEYEPQNLFASNFLPVFQDYYGHNSKIFKWVFKTEEDGKIASASKFEKYPTRIVTEFYFKNYSDETVELNIKKYEYDRNQINETSFRLYFTENYELNKIENLSTGYNPLPFVEITGLNDQNFIEGTKRLKEDNTISRIEKFEYNLEDFLISKSSFNESNEIISQTDYTYTQFGDIKTEYSSNSNGSTFDYEYFYREDNTLSRLEVNTKFSTFETFSILDYDEDEALLKDTTMQFSSGETQKTIEEYLNGNLKTYTWFVNDLKKQYSIYEIDGSGANYISYTENYDDSGNLVSVQCFNSSGDEITCSN